MSLYTITDFTKDDIAFSATVTFDPDHGVFEGHFPGQPVVPGVFMIQIINDITGMISGSEMKLKQGGNIKFLQMIDPRIHPKTFVKGKFTNDEEKQYKITANMYSDNTVLLKFNGLFIPE